MPVKPLARVAISIHLPQGAPDATVHSYSAATGWTAPGDQTAATSLTDATTLGPRVIITGVEVENRKPARTIVTLGDSITDGTASTLNGDDRWPDVLSRRLHARFGNKIAIVNAGIGGNQVIGPARYSPAEPFAGGPSALDRLERDVLSLSGVTSVIWLEGTNDFSKNGNASAEAVMEGMRRGVARMRERIPGIQVLGATVVSALGSTSAAHGSTVQNEKRQALNQFIRTSGVFDGVVEFDAVILDPVSGGMKVDFIHDTTVGGPGDKLHPNRLGYQVMGLAIDVRTLTGR